MQRPATNKARGQCRFVSVPGGCLNGDSCKFLHGEGETLTPYDKSKRCKFFAAGFCRRGEQCWFLHDKPLSPPSEGEPSGSNSESQSSEKDVEQEPCAICLDKPVTYGLLSGCGHIFCLDCIRNWRTRQGKAEDVVESGNIKKCPYCRAHSPFVTPSSSFFPDGDPRKIQVIEQYKASMAKVPCKYFAASNPSNRRCPYGKDCFYQHKNLDGSDYVFPYGAEFYLARFHSRNNGTFASTALDTLRRLLPMIPIIDSGFRPHGSEVDDSQGSNRLSTLLSNLLEFTRTYGDLPDVMSSDHETMEDYVARLVVFLSSRMNTVVPESNTPGRLVAGRERNSVLPLIRATVSSENNLYPIHSNENNPPDSIGRDTPSPTLGGSTDRDEETTSDGPVRLFAVADLDDMPALQDSDDEDSDDSENDEESSIFELESVDNSPPFGPSYDLLADREFMSLADRLVRFDTLGDAETEAGEEEVRSERVEAGQRTTSSLSSYTLSNFAGLSNPAESSSQSNPPAVNLPISSPSPSDSNSLNADLSSAPASTTRSDEHDEDALTLSPPHSSAAFFKELRRSRSEPLTSRSGNDATVTTSATGTTAPQGFVTDGRGRVIRAPE